MDDLVAAPNCRDCLHATEDMQGSDGSLLWFCGHCGRIDPAWD